MRHILISGERGAGKSTLLHKKAVRARCGGALPDIHTQGGNKGGRAQL